MNASWLATGASFRQAVSKWLATTRIGIILLPWLATAGCILFEKIFIMNFRNAFTSIAISLHTPPAIHFWEWAGLYRADLLTCFVLMPLSFCLVTGKLSLRGRIAITILVAFLVEIIVTIEALSYAAVYGFPSIQSVLYSLLWQLQNHDAGLFQAPLIKFAEVNAFVGVISIFAVVALKKNIRWINHLTLAVFAVGAAASAIAYIPRVPAMPWSQSMLRISLYQGFVKDSQFFGAHNLSVSELMERYRSAAHLPPPQQSEYTGKAKDYNVIVILMESMTAQAFDPARDSLSDMPNVRRLRDQSFLMGRHYTSYPITDNATFSVFTSLYMQTEWGTVHSLTTLPGFVREARRNGYQTGFYGFVWTTAGHRDDLLLSSLGFDKLVSPDNDHSGGNTFYGQMHFVEADDHAALESMQADIRNWTAHKQKFATAYFPEIGHDPYRELDGRTSKTALERGHALAVYQDAWLGELLDELQRDGALDHTIIVMTGDHGMRYLPGRDSKHMVPISSRGMLEDVTMRVPMLIYAPGILKHSVAIDAPTSHVDITPTLLDLMGITTGRELEQGLPVYRHDLDQRRLFLEMDYLGASGFYDAGNYYSDSIMGVVYKNSILDFGLSNELPYDSKEAEQARSVMDQQDANQNALLSHVLAGQSVHGAVQP